MIILHVLTGHARGIACGLFVKEAVAVTGSIDGTVRVWDAESGANSKIIGISPGWASLSLSTDGSQLACGMLNKSVTIFDSTTFEPVRDISAQSQVYRVWFADDHILLIGAINSPLIAFDVSLGTEVAQYGHLANPRIASSKRGE